MEASVAWRRSGAPLLWISGITLLAVGCSDELASTGTTGSSGSTTMQTTGASGSDNGGGASANGSGTPIDGGGQAETPASTTGTATAPTGDAGAPGSSPVFHCDVASIFQSRCQSCHAQELQHGAPMPLVDYADLQGMGPITRDQTILSLIGARIHDAQRPMPPGAPLTSEEKATIDAWLAAGAPAGEGRDCGGETALPEADGGAPETPGEWPPADADDCFEVVAHAEGDPDAPHMVKAGTETHPGIVFDAPWGDRPAQAVGFRPITDNTKVIHHWIVYQNGTYPQGFLVGWAPGNQLPQPPEDVGIYVPSGEQSLYLDLHYYNLAGTTDEPDMSGVEICVVYEDKMRPHTATVFQSFSNLSFALPPQQETETVGYCRVRSQGPIHVLDVFPHMHEYGYHAKLEVKRADSGEVEVWHDAGFTFDEQRIYPLDKILYPGDVVKTTCEHRNTSSTTVTYGPDTGDEMCFNFVNYYPMGELGCDFAAGLEPF